MPGIMPMTLSRGPSFMTDWNCLYMSRSVNCPLDIFSINSFWFWVLFMDFISSMRPRTSPNPRSLCGWLLLRVGYYCVCGDFFCVLLSLLSLLSLLLLLILSLMMK